MSSFDAREAFKMAQKQIEIARANGQGDAIVVEPKRRRIINEKPRNYPKTGLVKQVNISKPDDSDKQPSFFNPDLTEEQIMNESMSNREQASIQHMDEATLINRYNAAAANRTKQYQEEQQIAKQVEQPVQQPVQDVVRQQPVQEAIQNQSVQSNVNTSVPQQPTPQPIIQQPNVSVPPQQLYVEPVYTDAEFITLDEIPSLNLFYPNKLAAQPLKLLDLLIIENLDDANAMDSFSEIYHRRIKGINPLEIASGDEIYMLQYLRASTFEHDPYTWKKFKCSHCGFEIDDDGYKIDFTNMRFVPNKDPNEIYDLHKEYGYHPIKISNGYLEAFIRRRRHDAIYKNKIAELERQGSKITKPYLALLNTALVLDIPGCNTLDSKIEYLGNLNKDDAYTMFKELKECSFKTTTHVVHKCPNCGGETVNPFPFRYDTFISSVQLDGNQKKQNNDKRRNGK